MKHYLLRILLLVLLGCAGVASAVTLGEARVKSFLGQPLNVAIDLIGLDPGQQESLRLRIANDRHFDRLGIVYSRFLSELNFDVVQSDGRWMVRVRSNRPATEPFIEFPLQLTWPGGQMIRHYTLLLDPPRRVQTARVTSARQAQPSPTATGPTASDGDSSYGPVRSGETLWPIAQKLKPRGITTRQMAMALLRANPQAFIDGNINRLRAGATLRIPQRSFIEQLDASSARAEFAAQTRQWQAPIATSPRTADTAVSVTPAPQPVTEPESSEEPKDTVAAQAAEEKEPAGAQLRILTEKIKKDEQGEAVESQQDLQEQLLVTMEEIESNRITTDAIESRLARMESELARMQKLIELKDAQIAALQAEAAASEAIRRAAQVAEPEAPPPAAVTTPAEQPAPTASPERAPISITRIEPLPTDSARPSVRPWYEEYLWAIWVVLGLMGLTALLLLMRRPQPVSQEAVLADLPEVDSTPKPAAFRVKDELPEAGVAGAALKESEEDFHRPAEQQMAEAAALEAEKQIPEEELPELDLPVRRDADDVIEDGITESLLREAAELNEQSVDHRPTTAKEPGFSDDDIASWVAELDAEVDQTGTHSANDEKISLDDDVPSILTELDQRLAPEAPPAAATPAADEVSPAGGTVEDDTFNMSLDLARAYLEIGDQEGARDMLKQALGGARDPDHRRQIEELLQQID